MKTTIKISAMCILLSAACNPVMAQVGIGVASPHSSSILDMTNTNSKGVLMPFSVTAPSLLTTAPAGLVIYYKNGLYLRDSINQAFNNLSSWKYKYGSSVAESMYFNPTGLEGVGIGVNTSISGFFHVSDSTKQVKSSGNSAAIFIGKNTSAPHMIFDADEIMVKSDASTGGLLKLQEEDGSLQVGSDRAEITDSVVVYLNTTVGSPTKHKNVNVYGKVSEYGDVLMPFGAIIMWNGETAPYGWALCDGGSYPKSDGTGSHTTPDLRGKFIVGYHSTDGDYDSIGDNGGGKKVALTITELASHSHSVIDPGHTHTSYIDNHWPSGYGDDADDKNFHDWDGNHQKSETTSSNKTNISIGSTGDGTPHENRPPYYTLAYIMKL